MNDNFDHLASYSKKTFVEKKTRLGSVPFDRLSILKCCTIKEQYKSSVGIHLD